MKEVNYDEKIQLILTYQDDLWTKILPKGLEDTKWVDIATYNFNFLDNNRDGAFYSKLREIANKGVDIRLIFSKAYEDKIKLDEFFCNSVYCVQNQHNHAKIFLTENLGYVGSANFSFGSNKNYECGILIKDKLLIEEIRKNIFLQLLNGNPINTPYPDFLLYKVRELCNESTQILNMLDGISFSDKKLNSEVSIYINLLCQEEYQNLLYELGFNTSHIDELRNKFNLDFRGSNYEYVKFASKIQDNPEYISMEDFVTFYDYLKDLNEFCIKAKSLIESSYANVGREKYMDDLVCNTTLDNRL